jgi:hypothetical protein
MGNSDQVTKYSILAPMGEVEWKQSKKENFMHKFNVKKATAIPFMLHYSL